MKLTPSSLPSYSSLECKALSGLLSDFSHNPNYSNKTIDIGKSSFFIFFLYKNVICFLQFQIIFPHLQVVLILSLGNMFVLFVGIFGKIYF
jgi:hypothetical protein